MAKSIDDIGMAFVETEGQLSTLPDSDTFVCRVSLILATSAGYVGQATLPDASVTPIVGGPQQVPAMQRTERLEGTRTALLRFGCSWHSAEA